MDHESLDFEVLEATKSSLLDHWRMNWDEAKFERIKHLSHIDPGTSAILLVELVGDMAQSWFEINGRFVPSPKEFLATFAEDCPQLEDLFRDFHLNSSELEARFGQAEKMLKVVYC